MVSHPFKMATTGAKNIGVGEESHKKVLRREDVYEEVEDPIVRMAAPQDGAAEGKGVPGAEALFIAAKSESLIIGALDALPNAGRNYTIGAPATITAGKESASTTKVIAYATKAQRGGNRFIAMASAFDMKEGVAIETGTASRSITNLMPGLTMIDAGRMTGYLSHATEAENLANIVFFARLFALYAALSAQPAGGAPFLNAVAGLGIAWAARAVLAPVLTPPNAAQVGTFLDDVGNAVSQSMPLTLLDGANTLLPLTNAIIQVFWHASRAFCDAAAGNNQHTVRQFADVHPIYIMRPQNSVPANPAAPIVNTAADVLAAIEWALKATGDYTGLVKGYLMFVGSTRFLHIHTTQFASAQSTFPNSNPGIAYVDAALLLRSAGWTAGQAIPANDPVLVELDRLVGQTGVGQMPPNVVANGFKVPAGYIAPFDGIANVLVADNSDEYLRQHGLPAYLAMAEQALAWNLAVGLGIANPQGNPAPPTLDRMETENALYADGLQGKLLSANSTGLKTLQLIVTTKMSDTKPTMTSLDATTKTAVNSILRSMGNGLAFWRMASFMAMMMRAAMDSAINILNVSRRSLSQTGGNLNSTDPDVDALFDQAIEGLTAYMQPRDVMVRSCEISSRYTGYNPIVQMALLDTAIINPFGSVKSDPDWMQPVAMPPIVQQLFFGPSVAAGFGALRPNLRSLNVIVKQPGGILNAPTENMSAHDAAHLMLIYSHAAGVRASLERTVTVQDPDYPGTCKSAVVVNLNLEDVRPSSFVPGSVNYYHSSAEVVAINDGNLGVWRVATARCVFTNTVPRAGARPNRDGIVIEAQSSTDSQSMGGLGNPHPVGTVWLNTVGALDTADYKARSRVLPTPRPTGPVVAGAAAPAPPAAIVDAVMVAVQKAVSAEVQRFAVTATYSTVTKLLKIASGKADMERLMRGKYGNGVAGAMERLSLGPKFLQGSDTPKTGSDAETGQANGGGDRHTTAALGAGAALSAKN